jgi:hypothetical protein
LPVFSGPAAAPAFGQKPDSSSTVAVISSAAEPVTSTLQGDAPALSAFVVAEPKKKEGAEADGRLRDDVARQSGERAVPGARPSELAEEQKAAFDQAAPRRAGQATGAEETKAANEPVSTFSLHVSDVSFRLAVAAAAAFERGENARMPEVRAEEFYNAFDYGRPRRPRRKWARASSSPCIPCCSSGICCGSR